jgi:hypothetical protein
VLLCLLGLGPAASAAPIEAYPRYQPQTRCHPEARPGTTFLGHRVVRRFGGGFGPIARPCGGGTSEHKEGRAFDWLLDARRKADQERAQAFLDWITATDARGNEDARARRMGIMYVIWDDHMYGAWTGFEPEPYLSSSCERRRGCGATLRHRNHLHISLSRQGGKGLTSWFVARMPQEPAQP